MRYEMGFGKCIAEVYINDENILGILEPNQVRHELSGKEEVKRALSEPIGSKKLKDIVKHGEKVVIITSDITRPMPSKLVLPEILGELFEASVEISDIKIVFALGSHRKHTEEEKRYLVGDAIYSKIECLDSDISDCVHLGTTSGGTPVDIFRVVAEADRRICLGNIEYHYFAGYSGGAKAIMPGVSTRAAIQANHSKMVEKEAKAGEMDHNPVRMDIEEVINLIPIDFILNVVLDEKKNIMKAVAGHHILAHREGCRFLDQLYKIEISQPADIVIVSAGGYPKDINLYQAQKALDNAKHAVRNGGIIILVAACQDGLGEKVFEKWMLRARTTQWLVDEIQKNFELGGHKAAAIGMVLQNARIFLVSGLTRSLVKKLFMEPFESVQDALDMAFEQLGRDAKVLLMPYGGSTLPVLEKALLVKQRR
jgi:nickel-dependent lactate racemase